MNAEKLRVSSVSQLFNIFSWSKYLKMKYVKRKLARVSQTLQQNCHCYKLVVENAEIDIQLSLSESFALCDKTKVKVIIVNKNVCTEFGKVMCAIVIVCLYYLANMVHKMHARL